MRPTLRQLEYAVAVADALNFRKAAEACFVSQPGLSSQLQELEGQLGIRLFERDKRKVLITQAGERVVDAARKILADVDRLLQSVKGPRDPFARTLRLGVIPTMAPYMLPRIMPAIRRRFPDLRLLLREEQTERLVALVEEGRLDLLLLAIDVDLHDLEIAPLFQDAFVVALPLDHRLAVRKAVQLRDLAGEQVLLLADGHCLRGQTASICDKAGACELGDFRATSLSTIVQMVASGIGITLLPVMSLEMELRSRRKFAVRGFASPRPSRTVGLAWRRTSLDREIFLQLAETFRETIAKKARRPF